LKKLSQQAFLGINLLENLGLNYYYSLANKFFDYLHAQVPSVNPAFPEYLNLLSAYETGIAVADLTPVNIAKNIQYLLDNPNKYAELQAECRRASLDLNWENEAKTLLEIYEVF
jgi:glycosyltransferase involved in cell wall biosynthesis